MKLGTGRLFQYIGKIVYPPLAQERKAPVVLCAFEMNKGFAGTYVKFAAIKTLKKILVGDVTKTGSKLPVIRQELSVPPAESSAKFITVLSNILPCVTPAQSVFSGIFYYITFNLAKRVFLRFARAFVSGSITGLLAVAPLSGYSIMEAKAWGLALVAGAITGGLMALDKVVRK